MENRVHRSKTHQLICMCAGRNDFRLLLDWIHFFFVQNCISTTKAEETVKDSTSFLQHQTLFLNTLWWWKHLYKNSCILSIQKFKHHAFLEYQRKFERIYRRRALCSKIIFKIIYFVFFKVVVLHQKAWHTTNITSSTIKFSNHKNGWKKGFISNLTPRLIFQMCNFRNDSLNLNYNVSVTSEGNKNIGVICCLSLCGFIFLDYEKIKRKRSE